MWATLMQYGVIYMYEEGGRQTEVSLMSMLLFAVISNAFVNEISV
jgi:hypothetical protein